MDNLSLTVEPRSKVGKSAARRLRREGKVPGVVYGIKDPTPVTINPSDLEKIFTTGAGTNVILQLDVVGEKKSDRPVLVKDLQRDAMSDQIMHADFLEIHMDRKIQVSIPFNFEGESAGVKLGGVFSVLLRELDVECLPNAIPEGIPVDVTALEVGDVIHVRDIVIPADVDLASPPDDPVVTVIMPVEEEVPEEAEDEEALAAEEEGATPEGAAESGDAEASSGDARKKEE